MDVKSWTVKKAECWRTDAFELWCWRRVLKVPWIARRSNQSILKEISPGLFTGRTDVEAETPILWPPHPRSWLIGKDPDAGRDWGQEEKGTTEDELAGWHHWLDAHEFEWTLVVGDGQGSLVCCDSWGCNESDMSERLKWTELKMYLVKMLSLYVYMISMVKRKRNHWKTVSQIPQVDQSIASRAVSIRFITQVCFLVSNVCQAEYFSLLMNQWKC